MRKLIAISALSGLLAATGAIAAVQGMNPASPNLFTVTDTNIWGGNIANNKGSAMCYDCHGVAPKSATAGSHFVAKLATDLTNSGGSGINNANAAAVRDGAGAGQYFGLSDWSAIDSDMAGTLQTGGRYSKYYDTAASVSKMIANTNNPAATTEATAANFATFELICESCHNIIVNDVGGNLLLANQSTRGGSPTLGVYYHQGPESTLCVGCHGFMFTANDANIGNANYGDARNTSEATGALRGNNEFHWVWDAGAQKPFAQNHHVMTGDNIDNTRAGAKLLWTDNAIVSYSRNPFANNVTAGSTYPAPVGSWIPDFPKQVAGSNMNCTNCHTPAHLGDLTEGASILRNHTNPAVSLGGGGSAPTTRIASGATPAFNRGGFKKFNDAVYCNQCH